MSASREDKLLWLAAMGLNLDAIPQPKYDWRFISNGFNIPTKGYADQPFIVKTDDGAWLCVMTTGTQCEGQKGQHVISVRTFDHGKTWTNELEVEPSSGVEASYAVLLKAPTGRIFCFYNHNTDDIRLAKADPKVFPNGLCERVDSLGHFVFKYSDDGGQSWSQNRYDLEIRETEIDRNNPYGGKVKYFWNVGKPFIYKGCAFVSLHKVGGLGNGFFTKTEGVLLKSDNLLTEKDLSKIRWETLPDGDIGLRTPAGGGPVAEEQSYSLMSDGSFFCVYRTVDGHPACAYSRDGGHKWTDPQYMTYTVGGRKVKHPRAANFAWKCSNGRYLYWFHNHGGKNYEDRNPVWMICGKEVQTPQGLQIEWSQPEILLYDEDPMVRMSYPDLVEENGEFYVTETEKHLARTHKIDGKFIDVLFNFDKNATAVSDGLIFSKQGERLSGQADMPKLPQLLARDMFDPSYKTLDMRNGITIDLWIKAASLKAGQILLDARNDAKTGFVVSVGENAAIELKLSDGITKCSWESDQDTIKAGKLHHIAIMIDGGPKIISFVVDGVFCDGNSQRQFGWGRYNPNLRTLTNSGKFMISPDFDGEVKSVKIYNRAIMTNEAISNFRAGLK